MNEQLQGFYKKLLFVLKQPIFREGSWKLLEPIQAWDRNRSHENYICFAWESSNKEKALVVVNYSSKRSQCHVKLPFAGLKSKTWTLKDMFSNVSYERAGDGIETNGMYFDEPEWKYYAFIIEAVTSARELTLSRIEI